MAGETLTDRNSNQSHQRQLYHLHRKCPAHGSMVSPESYESLSLDYLFKGAYSLMCKVNVFAPTDPCSWFLFTCWFGGCTNGP